MNVLNNYTDSTTQTKASTTQRDVKVTPILKDDYKPDILDIFSEKVVNKKDLNDMVTCPRAIFKGYLCFTTGTALNAISAMLKQNKFSKALTVAGSLISIYGTYNFVKPFLIKDNGSPKEEK